MEKWKKKSKSKDRSKIWSEFVNGEFELFKELFKAYYSGMLGYGTKICYSQEIVKDSIQEIFKNIWERKEELDHIDSPNVYLYVSLRRKILKKLQRGAKEGELSEIDPHKFMQFSKEDLIITDEIKHRNKKKLKKALNQISDRQREVIYLHFYNGMSYGEIEEILSINRQSVYNHIYRALESLRTILSIENMKLLISLLLSFALYYHSF